MSERRILILKSDKSDFERFYINHMQDKNVSTFPLYKVNSGFWWYVAVICLEKLNLPCNFFLNNKWKYHIEKYDMVIVFDRNLNWNIFKYIKKHNPKARCIAWYWNPITNPKRWCIPEDCKHICEAWSFDQADCDKYGYQRNVQFYFDNLVDDNIYEQKKYDAFFIGTDKGRYGQVEEMISELQKAGLNIFRGVVADKDSNLEKEYINQIDYEEIIELIKNSECIIDVPQKDQEGITLRVLESLFWKKKLITTNNDIVNYSFYNKANVLVWNSIDKEKLSVFFKQEYESVNEEILKKYSFSDWLKNFG